MTEVLAMTTKFGVVVLDELRRNVRRLEQATEAGDGQHIGVVVALRSLRKIVGESTPPDRPPNDDECSKGGALHEQRHHRNGPRLAHNPWSEHCLRRCSRCEPSCPDARCDTCEPRL